MSDYDITDSILSDREIGLLFEIFEFPVESQFTVRGGLIGLGKSRILIANQDQLSDALFGYIQGLLPSQQQRVQELINQWDSISTKVVKFTKAERVEFRVNAPKEERYIIKNRIQMYIPIYTQQEVNSIYETGEMGSSGNEISRG